MPEEEKKVPNEPKKDTVPPTNSKVEEAKQILDLKNENEKLKKENAEYAEAQREYYNKIINGQDLRANEEPKGRTSGEIYKEISDPKKRAGRTNLDNAKLLIEMDDACIRENGKSCFLPPNSKYGITAEEEKQAKDARHILEEAIKSANGDPDVFNAVLPKIK